METKLKKLKTILGEVNDLNAAAALLDWDHQTYMPPEGAVARGHQLATLSSIAHDKFTSPEVGRLLAEVQPDVDQLDPDSDDARLVRVTQREYRQGHLRANRAGSRNGPGDLRGTQCVAGRARGEQLRQIPPPPGKDRGVCAAATRRCSPPTITSTIHCWTITNRG